MTMKNNKKIQFLLLFFTMLIGFAFATTVNADVTKDGDVYHITTGQDLADLLGAGNTGGYWRVQNPAPASISISVDNDITIPAQQALLNSNFSGTVNINFNNHMYYVADQNQSSFIMGTSTPDVSVVIHNLTSASSNISNTSGAATVPSPTDANATISGFLLGTNSLFSGLTGYGAANSGTITYDNVSINYPNLADGKSTMLTPMYVPMKFTGTNVLALGGLSGANFSTVSDAEIVSGSTTMTWGTSGSTAQTAMINMSANGTVNTSVAFTVDSGANLIINNHAKARTFLVGNTTAKTANITNNGTMSAVIDGNATNSTTGTDQTITSSFVVGGTGIANTNITFGPNSVSNITSNTGLIKMDNVAILNVSAQAGSQTTLESKNTQNNSAIRVFNGTAFSGSSLTLDGVAFFSMRNAATPPLQQDNMRIVIANTPLTILGYAANNDTVTARYVAEIGSINGAWDGNGTPGDQMSPPLATNSSATKLKPAFGIRFEPGLLANSFTVNPSVWNYALSNPIFPTDNTPVWLSRNGSGDNTQTFDVYDSRSQTASFSLQASVTGTGSRQYGFKKNSTNEVLSLNDQAQTILNASDFTAGTIGDAATAGHWTYTTDANHGLLVQAARSEKIGTYTGSVTYSLVDGLE
jgi:hypothetical protein